MTTRSKTRLIGLVIILVSFSVGLFVGLEIGGFTTGLLSGLFTYLWLISVYAVSAYVFGWPRLESNDMTALDNLLP